MRTIYLATYEGAKAKLENKIIESEAREKMLVESIALLEPVMHYKNLDKRITKALDNDSFYSWIPDGYTFRFELKLRNRNFANGDYFESDEESIYLDNEAEKTPKALEEGISARLEQLRVGISQYKEELANFKSIFEEAHKLACEYNAFQEKYSYAIINALEI